MVDTFMAYEQVKSLLYRAVCGLAEDSDDIECIVHALKALVGKTGKQILVRQFKYMVGWVSPMSLI